MRKSLNLVVIITISYIVCALNSYLKICWNTWYSFQHCVWTPTIDLSPGQIIAMEVLLRAIIPYLLPAFLLPWPLICLRRTFDEVEGIKLKSQLNSIIILSWCYIGLNFPYAVTFLIHYYSLWDQGVSET